MSAALVIDPTKLAKDFETRDTGVFKVICLKKEKAFEPFLPVNASDVVVQGSKAAPADDDDDSDDDLFGDSDDDEEADRLAELRISAAAKKHAEERAKAGKKKKVDKTLMVIEMNPLDAETDLTELEAGLREKITPETLKGMIHWGVEAKREDIAFGLQKLVMSMAVLDDDCSQDDITEMIEGLFEDSVGRVSVPTMSKI
eukprot:g3372.t1